MTIPGVGPPRLSCVPWQQIIDAVDLVIRDAGEGFGEPCLRIDAIQFGGLKQGVAMAAD